MFDDRQLECFIAVADEGQVTRAAAKLHVAQPALSQSIAKLEASVGFRLLDRHARGVSLTPAGEIFIQKARRAITSADDARAALQPFVRREQTLALGILPSLRPIARPIVRHFTDAHPDVEVQFKRLSPGSRLVELKSGAIDVELLFPPPSDPDLHVETVASAARYVLLRDSHPLAGEHSLRFAEIANETFPGRHPSVSQAWAEEAWLSHLRGHDPPVTAEQPLTLDETWALIRAGKAIAVLPAFMVPQTEGDGVRAVPLVDVPPLDVGLARRNDDARPIIRDLFDIVGRLNIEIQSHPHDASSGEAPPPRDRGTSE